MGGLHDFHCTGPKCRACVGRKKITSYQWVIVEGQLEEVGDIVCYRCKGTGREPPKPGKVKQ